MNEIKEAQENNVKTLKLEGITQKEFTEICKIKSLEELELNNTVFTELTDEITNLKNLTKLTLEGNEEIEEIPDAIGGLVNLKVLEIKSFKRLKVLPDTIGNLSNLQELLLSYNSLLEHLPESIGQLIKLKKLSFWECQISRIPNSFGNLINLESISCGDNPITELPATFIKLNNIEYFSGHSLPLKCPRYLTKKGFLPLAEYYANKEAYNYQYFERYKDNELTYWEITRHKQELVISYGDISGYGEKTKETTFGSLEKAIKDYDKKIAEKMKQGYEKETRGLSKYFSEALREIEDTELNEVTEFSCRIDSLEDFRTVCEMTSLKELTIKSTELLRLPEDIGKLIALEELTIEYGNNKFSSIHKNIKELKNLKKLTIKNAALYKVFDSISALPSLEELELIECNITALPDDFGNLKNLQKLNLKKNKISVLPESFSKLKNLVKLDLSKNRLKVLPTDIGDLENLKILRLIKNNLTELPSSIGKLKNLALANFRQNKLVNLDESICQLQNLHTLGLSYNNIELLPENIGNLANLKNLYINDNSLMDLPDSLSQLDNLLMLQIIANQLTELPVVVSMLKNIEEIWAEENPFNISEDLVENIDILDYFFRQWNPDGKKFLIPIYQPSDEEQKLTEKEKKKVLKAYEDRLKQFKRDTKYQDEEDVEKILEFISGRGNKVPLFENEDYYWWKEIIKVFSPIREWTFIDRRILTFLTSSGWRFLKEDKNEKEREDGSKKTYYSGYFKDFYSWLEKQLKADADAFTIALEELKNCGVDDDEQLIPPVTTELYESLLDDNNNATAVGEYVLSKYDDYYDLMIESTKGYIYQNPLFGLFAKYKAEDFDTKLVILLFTGECSPHVKLEYLCKIDPLKYKEYLLRGMEMKDSCRVCTMRTAKLLVEYYGGDYYELALEETKKTFTYIKEQLEQDYKYYFPWISRWTDGLVDFVKWSLKIFGQDIIETVTKYVKDQKVVQLDLIEVVANQIGESGIDILCEALKMKDTGDLTEHYSRVFDLLEPFDVSDYYEDIWKIVSYKSFEVNKLAARFLAEKGEPVLNQAFERVESNKAKDKEAGLLVLTYFKENEEAIKVLNDYKLQIEDPNLRKMIQATAGITINEVLNIIDSFKATHKLSKPVKKWLVEEKLPLLKWKDSGDEIDTDTIRYMFYVQSKIKEIELSEEVKILLNAISKSDSDGFADELLNLIIKNGGLRANKRFALGILGTLAGSDAIKELTEIAIKDKNINATKVIGYSKLDEAVFALDKITKAFKTKYPNVLREAEAALDDMADEKGISTSELLEIAIPNFGFTGRIKEYLFTDKKYKGFINNKFALNFIDEKGKVIKSLPSAATASDKAEIKEMKKELRQAKVQQIECLEMSLLSQRKWTAEKWKTIFLNNPLMHALAKTLVWGVYSQGTLIETFRVTENITFVTLDDNTLNLTSKNWKSDLEVLLGMYGPKPYRERDKQLYSEIGIVHPIELEEEKLEKWMTILKKEKVVQALPQLEREVFTKTDAELHKKFNWIFEDKVIKKFAFSNLGWRRGSVVDGGGVSGYKKQYKHANVDVFVELENVNVQGYFDEGKIKKFYFVQGETVYTGSYVYDEPINEEDKRLIMMEDIPEIIYSETVRDLKVITGELKWKQI